LGSSLPPAELARRDSALFAEVKCLFSSAPEVRKETEANGGHRGDRTLDRTRSLYDRTRPVSVQRLRVFQFDDRKHSVSGPIDRTRPVIQGAYWTPTGRWHCGVRSVLQRVRSLFRCALLRLDQRVRSVTGPARPVAPSASGLRDQRVRSVFRNLAVA
jgi:hypothetical protein